jgi:hypothetical protein
LGTGAVGVGVGLVVAAPAASVVVVGATVVVGACTSGSDFSPHPAAARTAIAAVPSASSRSRRPAEA